MDRVRIQVIKRYDVYCLWDRALCSLVDINRRTLHEEISQVHQCMIIRMDMRTVVNL